MDGYVGQGREIVVTVQITDRREGLVRILGGRSGVAPEQLG